MADKDFGRCRTDFPNPLSLFRRLVFARSAPCSCFLGIPNSIHDGSLFLFRDDFGTNARLHIGILNRIHYSKTHLRNRFLSQILLHRFG